MAQIVRDIMTKDVQTVTPNTVLKDAAQIMKTRDFGSVPVVEGRKAIGVITDRDIAIRGVAEGRDPASTKVSDVMTREVVAVHETDDLLEAERLMTDRQLRRLPVLNEQEELVGYLAMAKVARNESPEKAGKVIKGVSEPSKKTG
jgi:CBS domain-containing protein